MSMSPRGLIGLSLFVGAATLFVVWLLRPPVTPSAPAPVARAPYWVRVLWVRLPDGEAVEWGWWSTPVQEDEPAILFRTVRLDSYVVWHRANGTVRRRVASWEPEHAAIYGSKDLQRLWVIQPIGSGQVWGTVDRAAGTLETGETQSASAAVTDGVLLAAQPGWWLAEPGARPYVDDTGTVSGRAHRPSHHPVRSAGHGSALVSPLRQWSASDRWERGLWVRLPDGDAIEYGWTVRSPDPSAAPAAPPIACLIWHVGYPPRHRPARIWLVQAGDIPLNVEIRCETLSDPRRVWLIDGDTSSILCTVDLAISEFLNRRGTPMDWRSPLAEQVKAAAEGRPGTKPLPEWARLDGGVFLVGTF